MAGAGVYLAYPIDQAQDSTWGRTRGIIGQVTAWLKAQGDVGYIYDPGLAFMIGQGDRSSGIRTINAAALREADLVIAFLPEGAVSVGVPMEIDRAVRQGKHVLVISDAPSWMLEFNSWSESRAYVASSWEDDGRAWVSHALLALSRATRAPQGVRVPVVVAEGEEEPRRGYPNDAGFDLFVSETVTIEPGCFADIPTGVAVQIPDDMWGLITGRSSTIRKKGLMVAQGVIDAGYRGLLYSGVWNLTGEPVEVKRGERIAQLILHYRPDVHMALVDSLEASDRGASGFGSTGY